MKILFRIILLICLVSVSYCLRYPIQPKDDVAPVPIVLWHGMGDSCCFSFSLGQIKTILEQEIPTVYVKSIRIGGDEIEDVERSYFGNINDQIEQVCKELASDERLQAGYNAIGFSQGAQFLRAVVERCNNPPVQNLISLGGQHQGVYGIPRCSSVNHRLCDYIRKMLNQGAYLKLVQEKFIQASYWHDPLNEEHYREYNLFLSDINNELDLNETYRNNMLTLKNLVLVMFANDTMVQPKESQLFGFYKPGQSTKILSMEDTKLYKQDRIGLKYLDQNGRVHMFELEADHLQFTDDWFIENIIRRYLI